MEELFCSVCTLLHAQAPTVSRQLQPGFVPRFYAIHGRIAELLTALDQALLPEALPTPVIAPHIRKATPEDGTPHHRFLATDALDQLRVIPGVRREPCRHTTMLWMTRQDDFSGTMHPVRSLGSIQCDLLRGEVGEPSSTVLWIIKDDAKTATPHLHSQGRLLEEPPGPQGRADPHDPLQSSLRACRFFLGSIHREVFARGQDHPGGRRSACAPLLPGGLIPGLITVHPPFAAAVFDRRTLRRAPGGILHRGTLHERYRSPEFDPPTQVLPVLKHLVDIVGPGSPAD